MAVVDSSVLIHLSRIGKINLLKEFFKKIRISKKVLEEIKQGRIGFSEVNEAIGGWIKLEELKNEKTAKKIAEEEDIEEADASLILLAKETKDILLSNDYLLIKSAKSKGIECWWLTTFLLRCLGRNILNKIETKQILFDLVKSGMRLDNLVYSALLKKIDEK